MYVSVSMIHYNYFSLFSSSFSFPILPGGKPQLARHFRRLHVVQDDK